MKPNNLFLLGFKNKEDKGQVLDGLPLAGVKSASLPQTVDVQHGFKPGPPFGLEDFVSMKEVNMATLKWFIPSLAGDTVLAIVSVGMCCTGCS
ncbi:hypothetical protein Tsubulata_007193, partial [Turnera subulata]